MNIYIIKKFTMLNSKLTPRSVKPSNQDGYSKITSGKDSYLTKGKNKDPTG